MAYWLGCSVALSTRIRPWHRFLGSCRALTLRQPLSILPPFLYLPRTTFLSEASTSSRIPSALGMPHVSASVKGWTLPPLPLESTPSCRWYSVVRPPATAPPPSGTEARDPSASLMAACAVLISEDLPVPTGPTTTMLGRTSPSLHIRRASSSRLRAAGSQLGGKARSALHRCSKMASLVRCSRVSVSMRLNPVLPSMSCSWTASLSPPVMTAIASCWLLFLRSTPSHPIT
mmetsp:Transcript_33110/g.83546  ORF Transcript_33110/g.83546 Transcript_33110/m.83546 type:complete len:231 (+) Transcript_33110:327-1019(+)